MSLMRKLLDALKMESTKEMDRGNGGHDGNL